MAENHSDENREAIPENWLWTTLGDTCEIIMGQSPPSSTYNDEGIGLPFFQGKAEFGDLYPTVQKWCSRPGKIAESEDILISVRAPVGPTNLCFEKSCIGRGLAALRPQNGMPSRYFLYLLRNLADEIAGKGTGSTFSAINKTILYEQVIPLAPLNEQRRIVDTIEALFSRLDAGIAALKRAQANLKRYKASVLKAACESRLVPQDPEDEPASELLARILAERRAKWEAEELAKYEAKGKKPPKNWRDKYPEPQPPDTSDLPDLPEGWVWVSIGQAFSVYVGSTPSRGKPEYWNGDIPWVSSGEVAFCRIKSTREQITQIGFENCSSEIHPVGTVLLGMIGEGKTRGQAAILDIPACHNQNSAAIRVSEVGVRPEFIFYYLEANYEQTRRRGSGGNQPALNKSRVEAMLFPLPPIAEQERIVQEIERLLSFYDDLGNVIARSLKRAERLRQSILSEAFAGRLVPQDPNDEPASILLERIRAEREQRR